MFRDGGILSRLPLFAVRNDEQRNNTMSIETGAGVSRQVVSDLKGRMLALKEHL